MSQKLKAVIADYDFGDVDVETTILNQAGIEVVAVQAKSEEDLIAVCRDCDAVINQYARVGARTIAAMERCKVIARYGIGVDIVDVEAATARNILVTNVRDYCTDEVADHALALLLALVKKLRQYDKATHQGEWRWQTGQPVYRMAGRTMGIVSFGRIGKAIAKRGQAFGLRVIAYDPYVEAEAMSAHDVEKADKERVVRESDYLMVQVPMTAETRHFIGEKEIMAMKPGAFIITTGRGPTVDNEALYRALEEGHIAGAGLDDLEEEPAKCKSWSPSENPLFGLENVLITPHAAYYSEESIRTARETAASEVARVLTGQEPRNPVNKVRLADATVSVSGSRIDV